MRYASWDRDRYARPLQDRLPARTGIPAECHDEDPETELAFHRVWLARQLTKLPAPRADSRRLPRRASEGVSQSVRQLWESVDRRDAWSEARAARQARRMP